MAEWFPKRERALATGIFNSGANCGAMISALFVPWCLIHFGDQLGWKMAFILTGAAGFFWLIFWFWLYETPMKQKRLSEAEYDYIHIDDEVAADKRAGDKAKISWWKLFNYRQTWAFFWGEISDRRRLVVLSVLAAGLFAQTIRHDQARSHAAHLHRLWRRHHRERLRRQHSHDAHKPGHGRLPGPA